MATAANFRGYSNFTLDSQAVNWVSEQRESTILYMLVDSVLVLVLVSWVFFFKVYSGIIAANSLVDRVQASQYAVEIKGLPSLREEGAPNEAELKQHFERFGMIHSVTLIRDCGSLLDLYQ